MPLLGAGGSLNVRLSCMVKSVTTFPVWLPPEESSQFMIPNSEEAVALRD